MRSAAEWWAEYWGADAYPWISAIQADARAGMVDEAELATLKSYREADVFLFRQKIARLESELAKAWEAGAQAQRERMAFAAQAWWSDIDGFPTGTELGDMLRGVPLVTMPKGER